MMQPEQVKNQQQAIAALLQHYFDGLYFSDVTILRQVFHPAATYVNAGQQPLFTLGMEAYFAMVAARAAPAASGQARQDSIQHIDLISTSVAIARVECVIAPKYFYDALTLVLVDGRWQIIAKVFDYRLL